MPDLAALVNLDDPLFRLGDRHSVYARLRQESPVHWFDRGRCWLLSRYEDVRYVSSNPAIYSAASGIALGDNLYPERNAARVPPGCENILGTDPPRHVQLRRLVSLGFTPRAVEALEDQIRAITCEVLDQFAPGDQVDFVEDIAVPIPLKVMTEMLGIPADDLPSFKRWSDSEFRTIDVGPGEPGWDQIAADIFEMWAYFATVLEERRKHPKDDLISRLLSAEIDGETLADGTTIMFCMSLLTAGNHTTRSLLAGGALALGQTPGSYDSLRRQPERTSDAVAEMLRWVTPFASMCRTATRDDQIRGTDIRAGDYVVMLYESANRDEEIWPNADTFDVTRASNPAHLSFGWGEHICLGAHLTRLEARIVLDELTRRFSGLEVTGEGEWIPSIGFNGMTSLPVVLQ